MIQANTVITGDSLTVLRDMEADSVDMVITDPPYGIDYQSGRKEKASRLAKSPTTRPRLSGGSMTPPES